ncbi:hypothetical protein [Mesomycoplasma hyopneumoniae]|uniref:Uncharacterized protein n=3 Tax=Mesomycoplasma hyopneumoniae TaxID=2099 RepID=Q4A7K5_MESH7|nr:hypothetical protein [Mesomycoplasma hyopneumoniae]AAZ53884.2 hypothetical protein MHP7448_0518 [Mesomycoplasma hyopneumoniae 7448]AGQ51139.1 hypothetical protein MHL_2872 [Mesomycoplasma hyopneumoniae 7422]MCI8283551.1 hypothetical protein [Mesomycoplasma hyopneumoniae]MCI8298481.1 hypothetical protein [Mesomycoplasma hyopneumoniae]
MTKNDSIKKYVAFFIFKIKQNKNDILISSIFSILFFVFLSLTLFIEFDFKSFVIKNGKSFDNFARWIKIINIFLIILSILTIIFLFLALFFLFKSRKFLKENNKLLEGLSLHFEIDSIKKEFLKTNNLLKDFDNFEYNDNLTISKFESFYNGLFIFTSKQKKKISSHIPTRKCSIKDVNLYEGYLILQDYKVNYFQKIKKKPLNLFIFSVLSWIILTIIFSLFSVFLLQSVIETIIFYSFKSVKMVSKVKMGPTLSYSNIVFSILSVFFVVFLCFVLYFINSKIFRPYLIEYYKFLTFGLIDFEKIENFEKNERYKNNLFLCVTNENNPKWEDVFNELGLNL